MEKIQQIINTSRYREDILRMLGFHKDFFEYFPKNYIKDHQDIVPIMIDIKMSESQSIFQIVNFKKDDSVLDYGSGIGLIGILLSEKCKKINLFEPVDFMKDMISEIVHDYSNIDIISKFNNEKYDKILCRAVIGEFEGIKDVIELKQLLTKFYKILNEDGCLCFNFHRKDGPNVHHSITQYDAGQIEHMVKQIGFKKFFRSNQTHKTECLAYK